MKRLYNFCRDCGRSGCVEGLFIAEEETVKKNIGASVSFGAILGKHSVVDGILEEEDITVIDVSEEAVKELEKAFGWSVCGYNPLEYIE